MMLTMETPDDILTNSRFLSNQRILWLSAICPSLTSVPLVRWWGQVAPTAEATLPLSRLFAGIVPTVSCSWSMSFKQGLRVRFIIMNSDIVVVFFLIVLHHLFGLHCHLVVIRSVSIVRHAVFEFVL